MQHHELQQVRLLCPPLFPRGCSDSCPLSGWCYLTISSSASHFFCLQSFWVSGYFPVSWLFASGSQRIGSSALVSVLPMNIQCRFPLRLTGLILQSKWILKNLLQHHNLKISIFQCSAFFVIQLSYPYKATRKTIDLTLWTFIGKMMSLFFNMLSYLSFQVYHTFVWQNLSYLSFQGASVF